MVTKKSAHFLVELHRKIEALFRTDTLSDIRRAQRQPMVRADSIGNDVTGKTEALQAQPICWNFHLTAVAKSHVTNNLAIPAKDIN